MRGKKLLQRSAFAEAAEQFRRVVQAVPNSADDRALWANALVLSGRVADAISQMHLALELQPGNPKLHAFLGQILAQGEQRVAAVLCYQRALELAPDAKVEERLTMLKVGISRSVHSWHLLMLADMARNDIYQAAIEAAVRPDDLVLDIGTGTGLLAMMAARAGAEQVVACEKNPDLGEIARIIIHENHYDDHINVVKKSSQDLIIGTDLPRRATLLVTETFDNILIGEGALDIFRHARAHLLAPSARIIPCGGVIRGQLVTVPRLKSLLPLRDLSGFDLRALARISLDKHYYPIDLNSECWVPLSEPFDVIRFDFMDDISDERRWSLPISATEAGKAQGILLWFDLYLDQTRTFSSGPQGKARHWHQMAFVLSEEQLVNPGDTVHVAAEMGGNVLHFELQ